MAKFNKHILSVLMTLFLISFSVTCMAIDQVTYTDSQGNKIVFPQEGREFTLVNNYPPGGLVDLSLRDFQPFVAKQIGIPVVVESIPGASGLIGYNVVYRKPSDGYRIILSSSTFGPHIYPHLAPAKPPWKYKDWRAVCIYSDIPNSGITIRKDSKYKTFADLIKDARKRPGKVTVGTIGPGRIEDIQIMELQKLFGVKLNHVFYDGGGTLLTDLLTGDLDAIVTASIQHSDNPTVRVLVYLAKHMPSNHPTPDVPCLADYTDELKFSLKDVKTLGSTHYNGIQVKSDTPEPVFNRLVEVFKNVTHNPKWRDKVKTYRYPVWYPPKKAKKIYDTVYYGIEDMLKKGKALPRAKQK